MNLQSSFLSILMQEWFLILQTTLILIAGIWSIRESKKADRQWLYRLFQITAAMTIASIAYLGVFATRGNWALVGITQFSFCVTVWAFHQYQKSKYASAAKSSQL